LGNISTVACQNSYQKLVSIKPEISLFLLADSGFVHHGITGSVKGLNATALFIWFCLEEGLHVDEILQRLQQEQIALAASEAASLIDELMLFYETGKLSEYPEDYPEAWLEALQPIELGKSAKKLYKVFDSYFVFQSDDLALEIILEPLFSAVEVPVDQYQQGVANSYVFSVDRSGISDNDSNNRCTISVNKQRLNFSFTDKNFPCFLFDTVRKLAKKDVHFFAANHAALLRKNNQAFMMPAVSGSGKSTLSAVLMSKGFELFTDELVVLNENKQAIAMPLAIGLKEGSWPILADVYPELDELAIYQRSEEVRIKHLPVKAAFTPCEVDYLIFPMFDESCAKGLEVQPLMAIEAMFRLFQAGFHTHEFLTAAIFEQVLQWLLQRECISLNYSSAFKAAEYLDELAKAS
jgi:hypothetical protein